jgi:hypothetical protein
MKPLLLIISLLAIQTALRAQKDCDDAITSLQTNIDNADKLLVTWPTYNRFVAKKAAYFLSESGDLSLFGNYFIADVTDGRLTFGHNQVFKSGNDRIKSVLTYGVETNIVNNFANLFANHKFNNEIGINLKLTKLFSKKTTMGYSGGQQALMRSKRAAYIAILTRKKINDVTQVQSGLAAPAASLRATQQQTGLNDYCKKQGDKYKNEFYDYELEELEDVGSRKYNSFFTHWLSITSFIPVTNNVYETAALVTDPLETQKARFWKLGVNYSGITESKIGSVFFTVSADLNYNNTISIQSDTISKYSKADYIALVPGANPATLLNKSPDDVYIGHYESFWTPVFKIQGAYFPRFKSASKIGISGTLEKKTGKYDPLNFTLGIPMLLTDKDGERTINVEVQFKWTDISNTVNPSKTIGDKFIAGLSIGLPFSSIKY